jgi:23S rRNA pseudouridine2457 synthase|tara:strand:+ start:539 stop:1102 length:564 start_codon:yes stop_codon:yes gene_type:complete
VTQLLALYKPYQVLCQFSDNGSGKATLADYVDVADVYPAGRLDFKSEGLVLLTDSGRLQHHISAPHHKLEKRYLVQIEGQLRQSDLDELIRGVAIREHGRSHIARVHAVSLITEPRLPPRDPPVIAHRQHRSSWLELVLRTGINRQIRRSIATLGFPVLRLVRTAVGPWQLGELRPGEWRRLTAPRG